MSAIRFTHPKLHYSLLFLHCLFTGQWLRIYREAHYRVYLAVQFFRFVWVAVHRTPNQWDSLSCTISRPLAYDSLDNLHPKGAITSFRNPGFLFEMEKVFPFRAIRYLDLGCARGALVKAARALGWSAYGIDGSAAAAQPSFFLLNGDITQPIDCTPRFDLITAWEVLEHIPAGSILGVVNNIVKNLKPGGFFIASTNDEPELHDGVDLHVTKLTNSQWKTMVAALSAGRLVEIDLGLKPHQFARQNFKNPSFLVYQRTTHEN